MGGAKPSLLASRAPRYRRETIERATKTRLAILAVLTAVLVGLPAYLHFATDYFEISPNEVIEPTPCNVCGETVPFKTRRGRAHAVCSSCGAYERHRLLTHYLGQAPELSEGKRVLHFAPNNGVEAFMRGRAEALALDYKTADLFAIEDLKLDLADIDQPDASWDVVICYHVLEHVPDSDAAMSELFRVLAPGGVAILQVPLEIGRTQTYEDASITSPEGRLEHFGQEDHVRIYGTADFPRRLEAAGFEVEALDYLATLPTERVAEHHLARGPSEDGGPRFDERIFLARKPGASSDTP